MAVCLASSFITGLSNSQTVTLDPTQVYNTPNLVNSGVDPTSTTSAWQNVGSWNQGLPCWGPGGPVYCGPQPYFNNGSFNFSYGLTDVYQLVNIANALPNTGTGLRVNGFNFGFTAKNGNGWDNGQQDYLVAYVNIYGADGKQAQSYNYSAYTNKQYNWTNFNFSETFPTPYAAKDLSTARYGFVGYDTNFWAGPYGPEIYNVSFSLKYSVDPCSVDVLSSPSCPGYLDKINSLSAPVAPTATTTTTTTTATPMTTIAQPTTTPTDAAQPVTVPTTSSSTSTSAPPVVTTSTATVSVTPTATNPQPKVGEVTVSGSAPKTTISTSQILSIVRNEQARIGNLETSTAQQAITQAQQQADAAQQESLSISANTVAKSAASSQSMTTGSTPNNIYSLTTGPALTNQIITASAGPQSTQQTRMAEPYRMPVEETKSEGMKFNSTNPLNSFMNPTPTITQEVSESKSSTVNQKTQDNELAGGASISNMAKQPIGFENYMTAMRDGAFYAPKEIYRNQTVVDNARAQRLLSGASDRLHKEMVDSQYKLGN